ncbi:histidine triad protein [Halomonas sp. 1513]|nr:HIT family protein [Halomonas sp. 1513]APX94485.1 histidine triad protein [Halomonas sp. 1513]
MHELTLDPRLEADTYPVTELPLSRVLLMNDARFAWLVLVPRRNGACEVSDLSEADQAQLWREATRLGSELKSALGGDKLNIAALGNVVSQLHVHVIVRHRDDAAWPAPVWGHGEAQPYDLDGQAERRDLVLALVEGMRFEH